MLRRARGEGAAAPAPATVARFVAAEADAGRVVATPRRRLDAIRSGPLYSRVYRSGPVGSNAHCTATVAERVKGAARRAGLDAARDAGYSLRRGFLTSAAESKPSPLKLLKPSRHRRVESVRGSIAEADRFDHHAGEALLRDSGRSDA